MFRTTSKDAYTKAFKTIDVSKIFPKRKTISDKIKEDIELEKLTRLLK